MNYTRKSLPYPAGEVCIRGPALFIGYFKNKKLTDETVDKDGWLHTGDVGIICEKNQLKIIDRVKNIFKLSQGEYIVPEKLERAFEQAPLIASCFIHGDSLRNHIVAIIYPEPNELQKLCDSLGLEVSIHHPQVFKQIEADLARLAKEHGFNSLEKVHANF